ncbi:GDP-mannose 4,6-dehydratase [Streptomyces sp. A1136]|uniref:GDP-mannose 4,6-dehydratase n=1 Tax=Streptomyces sp. A1136 TaxID=2563102 RepID=UPI0023EFD068|nr:GDP-mannose 4,6-dehydratase [Streptomyces sp. A1136]
MTETGYPTRDGTGIRDYVHVWDLAAAHIAAIRRFDSILTEKKRSIAINLGTGSGTTVRELCAAFNNIVSTPLRTIDAAPRPGDVAGGYTKSDRAAELLGWTPKLSLEDGIRSALDWIPVRDAMLTD